MNWLGAARARRARLARARPRRSGRRWRCSRSSARGGMAGGLGWAARPTLTRRRDGASTAWIALCLLLAVASQVYVAGSVESWTVAGAFGQRRFVGLSAVLLVGLAALWPSRDRARPRGPAARPGRRARALRPRHLVEPRPDGAVRRRADGSPAADAGRQRVPYVRDRPARACPSSSIATCSRGTPSTRRRRVDAAGASPPPRPIAAVDLLYLADIRLPLERANGLQTMSTCHALAARGHRVTLLVRPDTAADARDPLAFYGLDPIDGFAIARVPVGGPGAAAARALPRRGRAPQPDAAAADGGLHARPRRGVAAGAAAAGRASAAGLRIARLRADGRRR